MLNLYAKLTAKMASYSEARQSSRGVTMLEYIMLAVLIVLVGLAIRAAFGPQLEAAFQRIADAFR